MTDGTIYRLAAAAHYVIARTAPEKLGAVKLNKVLWFADIEHYRRTGKTITGLDKYIRMPRGPVPYRIEEAISLLKEEEKISVRRTTVFTHERREFVWLKEPDISSFSSDEIDLLSQAIELISGLSAAQVSEFTHMDELWKELDNTCEMPIGAASVIPRPPTAKDMNWAAEAFGA